MVEAETSRLWRRNLRVQPVQFCYGFLLSYETPWTARLQLWRVFSFKIIPFNGTLYEFKGFQPVSISVSFCDLSVELYIPDLVKFLPRRLFQDIFFKMAGSGLAPALEDVRSFTVMFIHSDRVKVL